MIKTLQNLKKNSPEYDAVMNAELEVVESAHNFEYDRKTDEPIGRTDYPFPRYSVKIPNEMTGMSEVSTMDGYQPTYKMSEMKNMLKRLNADYDMCIADYPRHGDTLRIFYSDLVKAEAAIYFLKYIPSESYKLFKELA
tara:strand:+ start:149 stop:565 length:417 start_codon:yes stop_codon:yes gene_type:complete